MKQPDKSANQTKSDLKSRGKSDIEEPNLDQALSRIKEAVFIQNYTKKIC